MITLGNKQICEYCLTEACGEPCRFCGFDKANYKKEVGVLPPGSTLSGRYIVGRVIGKGGFGITYLAYDIKHEKKVALKEYYPTSFAARDDDGCTVVISHSDDAAIYKNGMEKFYEEASLVSKFNGNPNIVSVYEFFYENDTAYFVMELLQGCSLKSYIAEHGCLSPEQALYIADRVSNALMVAHSTNTLHRDISPDNIMLCTDGNVKLIDFGAARQVAADNPKSMSVILKQGFAPLEQYQKHGNQGPWTDLYSLGATLYYSVTESCIDDPMTRLDNDSDFQSNSFDIEPQLWEFIKHSLNLKIEDRYKDAFEFRAALGKIGYKPQEIKIELPEPAPVPEPVPVMAAAGAPQYVQPTSYAPAPAAVQPTSYAPAPAPAQPAAYAQQPAAAAVKKPVSKKLIGIIGAAAAAAIIICIIVIMAVTSTPSEVRIGMTMYPTDLTELDLSNQGLVDSDIQDLKYFKNLEILNLNKNNLTDLSVLKSVTTLKSLSFEENHVSDLSFASKLKDLEILLFYSNYISDLSPLEGTTKINHFRANQNPIKSLEPLKNNTGMKSLAVAYSSINGDISALSGMKNLEYIVLHGCELRDISALSGCKYLTTIVLGENYIYDLTPLKDCQGIQELNLNGNIMDFDNNGNTFFNSLFGLHIAEGGAIDLRNCDFYYTSVSGAKNEKNVILNNSNITDFEFYVDCENESGEKVPMKV